MVRGVGGGGWGDERERGAEGGGEGGRPTPAPPSPRDPATQAAASTPPLHPLAGGWGRGGASTCSRRHATPPLTPLSPIPLSPFFCLPLPPSLFPATLVALPRPVPYRERRADGYAEPELVLVVATAHLSAASPAAVGRVIGAAAPDAVVVELCRSRAGLVAEAEGGGPGGEGGAAAAANAANPWALSGSLARSAELGGLAAMAARVVLARWAARSADGLAAATAAATAGSGGGGTGPSPPVAEPASSASPALPSPAPPPPPAIRLGDDARAAAAAARAVGAALVLGDRPIELTVSRAWAALTWRDRVAAALLAAGARPTSPLVAETALPALLTALAAVEGTTPDARAGGAAASPAALSPSPPWTPCGPTRPPWRPWWSPWTPPPLAWAPPWSASGTRPLKPGWTRP